MAVYRLPMNNDWVRYFDADLSEWVKVFPGHEKFTTALLDRLAHHATGIATKGKSYRMRKRTSKSEKKESADETTLQKASRKA